MIIIADHYVVFDHEIQISIPYILLPTNVTRFGLGTTIVGSITAHFADWNVKFPLYCDPETQTKPAILAMKLLYEEFHPEILKVKKFIKDNPNITLTSKDYTKINIHQDADTRTHIARPTIIPGNNKEDQKGVNIQIFTFDPAHDTDKKLPVDVAKIGRKIAIVADKDAIPHPDDYKYIEATGSAVWKHVFKSEDLGKKIWITTCFINPTGEEGPWSEPISFMIY